MVKHRRRDGTEYWQLPGGGVQFGERLEDAVLRELHEETGLVGSVVRRLFTIPYKYGTSTTFLVNTHPDARASLGFDPEEAQADHQKLVDIAWLQLTDMKSSPEVAQLLGISSELFEP